MSSAGVAASQSSRKWAACRFIHAQRAGAGRPELLCGRSSARRGRLRTAWPMLASTRAKPVLKPMIGLRRKIRRREAPQLACSRRSS